MSTHKHVSGFRLFRAVVHSVDALTGVCHVYVPSMAGSSVIPVPPGEAYRRNPSGEWALPSVDDTVMIAVDGAGSDYHWVTPFDHTTSWEAIDNTAASVGTSWEVITSTSASVGVLDTRVDSLDSLVAVLTERMVPAGTIHATVGATADTGYLLVDGTLHTNAITNYPSLWGRIPATWKVSGTNMQLPDARGRTLFMDDSAALFTLGAIGGANTVTIVSANLPVHTHDLASHTHTINHDHANATVSVSDPGHSHPETNRVNNSHTSGYYHTRIGAGSNFDVQGSPSTARWDSVQYPATASATTGITASVDLPNYTGSSGGPSNNTSGNGGFANTAITVTNAHLTINWQIKAH